MDSKVPLQGQSQSGNLIKKTLDANINASTLLSLVARVQPTTNTVVYSSRIQQGKQSKRTQRPPLVLQVTGTARSANMILKPFYDDITPINHPVPTQIIPLRLGRNEPKGKRSLAQCLPFSVGFDYPPSPDGLLHQTSRPL